MAKTEHNQAFIDGQNLYVNTSKSRWSVDFWKFRKFLREKYKVDKAYYFVGALNLDCHSLYENIQEAGFILVFRAHAPEQLSAKKGNVDTDIVFTILSKIINKEKFDKVVLVSGDGDYYRMVDFLIKKRRFLKLLTPSRKSTSSLYRLIDNSFITNLDDKGLKQKIRHIKKTKK